MNLAATLLVTNLQQLTGVEFTYTLPREAWNRAVRGQLLEELHHSQWHHTTRPIRTTKVVPFWMPETQPSNVRLASEAFYDHLVRTLDPVRIVGTLPSRNH